MIHVVAMIITKPGKRAEFLTAYETNMPLVRTEPGCIEYGPKVDAPGSPAPAKVIHNTTALTEDQTLSSVQPAGFQIRSTAVCPGAPDQ